MSNEALFVIGNDIEYLGYKVAEISPDAPFTVVEDFRRLLLARSPSVISPCPTKTIHEPRKNK